MFVLRHVHSRTMDYINMHNSAVSSMPLRPDKFARRILFSTAYHYLSFFPLFTYLQRNAVEPYRPFNLYAYIHLLNRKHFITMDLKTVSLLRAHDSLYLIDDSRH